MDVQMVSERSNRSFTPLNLPGGLHYLPGFSLPDFCSQLPLNLVHSVSCIMVLPLELCQPNSCISAAAEFLILQFIFQVVPN